MIFKIWTFIDILHYICRKLLFATKCKSHCCFFVLVLYYAILVWEKWCETGVPCSSAIWNMLTLICFKCFRTSWKRILAGSHRFVYLIKQRWFNGVFAKFYIDLITCHTMMYEKNNWFHCCRFCCWSTCYVLISPKILE